MIKLENHLGVIDISQDYFVNLVGSVVTSCFGVAAMSHVSPSRNLLSRLRREKAADSASKGIRIRTRGQRLMIDLHIIVMYGTNIAAIVKSIMHKVRYTVEEKTGFEVARVNVYIDGMRTE